MSVSNLQLTSTFSEVGYLKGNPMFDIIYNRVICCVLCELRSVFWSLLLWGPLQ